MEDRRLYSPGYLKEILENHGFEFTKSLGQNFLIDGNIVRAIVEGSNIDKNDQVVEVGPGVGTLTEELSNKAREVLSIEIDRSLEPVLEDTLSGRDNVEVYFGDILEIDLEKLFNRKYPEGKIKLVANLPYYITTPILGRLLEEDLNFESITVMVQKEVADRMVAKPGSKNYSALSVFINFYTEAEIILKVPPTVFMPQPKVESAVVRLNVKEDLPRIDKKKFFTVVKASFAMRRKTLLNCLAKADFGLEKSEIEEALKAIDIDPRIRAERLDVDDFVKITQILFKED